MSIGKFPEFYVDVTKEATKIPQEQYHAVGRYPIIDQGQKSIAGMWDNSEGLYEKVPAIVFGDHTRVIKYVDTPFFIGADGVKVLRPADDGDNVKYLFYVLQAARIPNLGYSRHFKAVKELEIRMYPRKKQDEIVCVLEQVDSLIGQRQNEIMQMDQLVKSRFVEMFGDLVHGDKISTNKRKIGEIASVTKLAGFEFTKYIHYKDKGEKNDIIMLRGLNCKNGHLVLNDVKWIDKSTSDLLPRSKLYIGDILMTYAGTIGDVALVDADDKYHLAPNVGKITLTDKKKYNPVFVIHLLMYSHDYIMTFASQVAQASINMEKIRNFEFFFPEQELQNRFAAFVSEVDKSKLAVKQSLEKLETLKKSLMQQYFG